MNFIDEHGLASFKTEVITFGSGGGFAQESPSILLQIRLIREDSDHRGVGRIECSSFRVVDLNQDGNDELFITDLDGSYRVMYFDSENDYEPSDQSLRKRTDLQQIVDKGQLLFYPNPSVDYLFIRIDRFTAFTTIEMYDALGRLVIEKNMYSLTRFMDTSDFSPGLYTVQLKRQGQLVATEKLMIQQ